MPKSSDVVYKGEWELAYLCKHCGEYLSSNLTQSHWSEPCHRCGAVGKFVPAAIETSRRFVCTKKRLFRKDEGYYEWSGLSSDGDSIEPLMRGRKVSSTPLRVAAAGIASGLF